MKIDKNELREACRISEERFLSGTEIDEAVEFPAEQQQMMLRLANGKTVGRIKPRNIRRIAAVAAVMAVVLSVLILGTVADDQSVPFRIEYGDEANIFIATRKRDSSVDSLTVGFLPEGYENGTDNAVSEFSITYEYVNKSTGGIIYVTKDPTIAEIYFNSEGTTYYDFSDGENLYYFWRKDDTHCHLMWVDGDYIYDIWVLEVHMEEDTLLKMSKYIK